MKDYERLYKQYYQQNQQKKDLFLYRIDIGRKTVRSLSKELGCHVPWCSHRSFDTIVHGFALDR